MAASKVGPLCIDRRQERMMQSPEKAYGTSVPVESSVVADTKDVERPGRCGLELEGGMLVLGAWQFCVDSLV